MTRARVILVENHEPSQRVYRALLEPSFEVVEVLQDALDLVSRMAGARADVAVLDISLPEKSGIEAARELLTYHPALKVVFLTSHNSRAYLEEAFAAGASGYVLKCCASADLIAAVHAALKGETFISSPLGDSPTE